MTLYIQLTRGLKASVSEEDYELVSKYKWCADPIESGKLGFRAVTTIGGKPVRMHRLIMGLSHGDKRVIDHLDHNPLNNTRDNLRITTGINNTRRSKRVSSSCGYKGVRQTPAGRWRATGYAQGFKHLGTFDTKEEAAEAYNNFIIQEYGIENCVLNIISKD